MRGKQQPLKYILSTINERILRFNTKISGNNGEPKDDDEPNDERIDSEFKELVEVVICWVSELLLVVIIVVFGWVVIRVVWGLVSERRIAAAIASIVASGPMERCECQAEASGKRI